MGCDIHMFYEIKTEEGWQYYDWENQFEIGTYEDGSPRRDWDKIFDHPLHVGRNYNLFAILANVRNGRGFAGIPTGTGFIPIDYPRGLPGDVSPKIALESEQWGIDGHSHSYFLLSEILAYDWDGQGTTQYGVVDENQYLEFKQNGKPRMWCGDVSGGKVHHIPNDEMDGLIDGSLEREAGIEYYTRVEWQETYRQAVGSWFFEKTIAELLKLEQPENIRLVFWFDN